jgi:hypothetical protein
MPVEDAAVVAPAVQRSGMRLLSTDPLIDQAFDLAREFDHPVYDCLYVAAMGLLGARFVTWDKPLHAKLAGSRFGASVYLLSEVDRLLGDLDAKPWRAGQGNVASPSARKSWSSVTAAASLSRSIRTKLVQSVKLRRWSLRRTNNRQAASSSAGPTRTNWATSPDRSFSPRRWAAAQPKR